MARDLFSNQGSTTVSSGGTTAPAQGTTESWTVASSSTFPAASNAASPATQFYISDPALPSETILVTNVSGTTWSVTRGADGTTPVAHTAGFTVRNVVTAAWLTQTQDAAKTRQFDVLDYGADNTGVADSTTAFQACATAVQSYISTTKRAKFLIPQGKYTLSNTFVISGGNVTIDARGAYLKMTASKDFFRDYTTQDTTFTLNGRGLRVLGGTWDLDGHNRAQGVAAGNAGYSGFTVACSSDIVFRDLTIRNVKSYHGIDINTCDGVVVDSCRFEGFKNSHEWKTQVKVASTANLAVASGVVNGVVVDGYTLVTGDRILLKDQTTGSEKGIYIVAASGAASRATDMPNASTTAANDAAVNVLNGTTQAGMNYVQTVAAVTVGTTAQTWATTWHLQVKAATTGAITLSGAQTVDGVALVAGDRCLVQNQASAATNGIYTVNAGAWTRPTDADAASEVTAPCSVHVASGGTTYGGKDRTQTATVASIGVDAQNWSNEYIVDRYFSEACQIDEGDNNTPSKNVKVVNCYMGPAIDGSGLLSFGKMAGSHTDSPSIVYQNIQLIGNTSVASLSNAFQGDSWADAVITGNIVLGSSERGIRCLFNSSNTGPRITISGNTISNTTLHGIEIDGSSGTFADVNISNNTLTNTAMTSGNKTIRVDTCSRLTISGNEIQNNGTGDQGIYVTNVTGGTITGNGVYNAGLHGIQVAACTGVLVSGNVISQPGDGGIYFSAAASKCAAIGNYIIGANTSATSQNGSVVISGGTNDNIYVADNRIQKGTGTGSTQPFSVQGAANPTNIEFANNSLGSEWGSNSYANFATLANPSVKLTGQDGTAIASVTSTASASTTLADITGATISLPNAGTYRFKAILVVDGGTGTTTTCRIAPQGPTATTIAYNIAYGGGAAATPSSTQYTYTAWGGGVHYGAAMSTASTAYGVTLDGVAVVTAAGGTLKLQLARGAGTTNLTVSSGRLIVERIA